MLPASIEQRAIDNIQSGMSTEEAIKKAFEQEESMIYSLLSVSGLSKLGHEVAKEVGRAVYEKINNDKNGSSGKNDSFKG